MNLQKDDLKVIPLTSLCAHPKNRGINKEKVLEYVNSIRINGIIYEPVVKANDDGSYTILSCHHRIEACRILAKENPKYLHIKCKVKYLDDIDAELLLIDSNLTSPLTSYEKMMNIGRKEEIFKEKIVNGELGVGGPLRDIVAAHSSMLKTTQVGTYLRIYKRGTSTLKEALKKNLISVEAAAQICLLPAEQQNKALKSGKIMIKKEDVFCKSLKEALQHKLATKVEIKKHSLKFYFTDTEDLNRILEALHCLEDEL